MLHPLVAAIREVQGIPHIVLNSSLSRKATATSSLQLGIYVVDAHGHFASLRQIDFRLVPSRPGSDFLIRSNSRRQPANLCLLVRVGYVGGLMAACL